VDALNGIDFEWTTGQNSRRQFKVRFTKLDEFKNNHDTISFLCEDKNNFPKLASWTAYVKSTAIKVLMKEATDFEFTILRIKKLTDISLVHLHHYKYEEHADNDEDVNEASDAIWSGVTGIEQHQDKDDDDRDEDQPIDEEQQPVDEDQEPVDEEQSPVDEEQAQGDDEDNDEDTGEDTDDDDRKPSVDEDMDDGDCKPGTLNMEDVFENDFTQSAIAEEPSIILPSLPTMPEASSLAQFVAFDAGNVAQSALKISQLVTFDTGNVAQSASTLA
jgi:hypothetical protein